MKNMFAVLAATTVIGLAGAGYAADESAQSNATVEYKKNGGYETNRTTDQTTANGTDMSTERKVDVTVDSSGNVDKTVKNDSVVDPHGLGNKKNDNSETKIEEKSNGGYKQTTMSKHKDTNGTDTYYKTVTDVDVDNAGNVTSTVTSEKVVNPKGLWNETKSTSKTKTVNGTVTEHSEKTK